MLGADLVKTGGFGRQVRLRLQARQEIQCSRLRMLRIEAAFKHVDSLLESSGLEAHPGQHVAGQLVPGLEFQGPIGRIQSFLKHPSTQVLVSHSRGEVGVRGLYLFCYLCLVPVVWGLIENRSEPSPSPMSSTSMAP